MKWINQSFEIMDDINGESIIKKIELCGRVCYKSEAKITEDSAKKFINAAIKRGHESMLEHVSFTVRFITDRSTTHQLVRHRIASYSQESQRYVRYSDVVFINQVGIEAAENVHLTNHCAEVERKYRQLIVNDGLAPQVARAILPNCTKTEIIMTANLREWRAMLKLRTAKDAHPQIRALMRSLLIYLHDNIPVVFDDIYDKVYGCSK